MRRWLAAAADSESSGFGKERAPDQMKTVGTHGVAAEGIVHGPGLVGRSGSSLRAVGRTGRALRVAGSAGRIFWQWSSPLLSLVAGQRAGAFEFVAEGQLSYRVLDAKGRTQVEQDNDFSVTVADRKWLIRCVPRRFVKLGRQQLLADYTIASSDAIDFFQLTRFGSMVRASGRNTNNVFAGRIGPGSVPFGLSDPTLIVLWYGYASGGYLNHRPDPYIYPPTVFPRQEMYVNDFSVLATWSLGSAPPFLPTRIRTDCVPKSLARLASGADTGSAERPANDFLFAVVETTEQFGLLLPKTIEVRFGIRHPTNPAVRIPAARLDIHATSFHRRASVTDFRPALPGRTAISDLRTISPATPFGVSEPNALEWPNLETSLRKAMARSDALRHHPPSRGVWEGRVLLGVLLLGAPLVWGRTRWKRDPNEGGNTA